MGVSGTGSLVLGKLFDRFGFAILILPTLVSALFAPLVFLGDFWLTLVGAAIWGSAWASTNPSFLRQSRLWSRPAAAPLHLVFSPRAMASSGSLAAQ